MNERRLPNPTARRVGTYWVLGFVLAAGYAVVAGTGWHGNAELHTIMEVAPAILALVVGAMAVARYSYLKNQALLFVGTGFIGAGLLDGYHMIVTSAFMASHVPSTVSSVIPWIWVASRLFLSAMICLSWLAWIRQQRTGDAAWISERNVYLIGATLTLASFLFFAFVPLPRAYYPEFVFHRPEEFVPAAFFAIALVGYLRKGDWRRDEFEHFLVLSLIVGVFSEAVIMSFSTGLFDTQFDAAHLLKSVSYLFVLAGLFKSMSSFYRQSEDSAAYLRGVVTTVHEGIIGLDDCGVVMSFNPAATNIFGYEGEEVIGKNVSLLMAGKDHDNHDSYIRNYLETGQNKIIEIGREVEGRRKDGTMFPLDLAINEMSVSGKRAFTGVIRDVTERKRAEALAEKRTAQLALIKSVAVDANEIDDVDEFIRSCVDHICDFTGWPVGHVYRIKSDTDRVLHPARIWHFDDPARFENFRKITERTSFAPGVGLPGRVMESGRPEHIVDVTRDPNFPRAQQVGDIGVRGALAFPVNLDDECVMVLEFYSSVAEQIDRDIMDVLASTADQIGRRIERERAAQELRIAKEDSQRAEISAISASVRAESASLAKSDFLDNMSHELRTPLNGLLGFVEMMDQETLGPLGHEQYAEYIKIIGNSGQHLLSVINDILDYSKIESGRIELDPVAFDLSQVVEGVVELLASNAYEKGIDVGCFVEPDVPIALTGDQSRLRQILLNLMGNAIKFTEVGGVKLEVSLEAARGGETRLRFEVSDTGIGIDDEVQAKLFEKFSQADASTTRKYGGSGLGLAISKHLAALMHGEIGLVSELGAGSVFWFTAVLRTRADVRDETMAKVAGFLQGRRVMVVDDNHVNRLICRRHLEVLGAKVFEADGAQEALAVLGETGDETGGEPFELVILDHMMDGVDGVELGALIREQDKYDCLKMVLSSSSGQVVSNKNARDLGFEAALPKPLHRTAVLKCLARLYGINLVESAFSELGKATSGNSTGRSLYCLMAEDNNVNQLLLKTLLNEAGHQVDIAKNGCEAVEAAQQNSYDVILMDVHMPLMNGLEATRQIRNMTGAAGQVPILAVTAAAMLKDKDKCFLAGMNDFVSKPIDTAQLFQKMAFWTGTDGLNSSGVLQEIDAAANDEVGDDAALALDDFLDSIDDGPDAKQA